MEADVGLTKEAPAGWADGRPVLIRFLAVTWPVSPVRRMLFRLEISKAVGVVGVWQARQTPTFKRRDSPYRWGRSRDWIKSKKPNAPAVKRRPKTSQLGETCIDEL